jgi:hypothetical protein
LERNLLLSKQLKTDPAAAAVVVVSKAEEVAEAVVIAVDQVEEDIAAVPAEGIKVAEAADIKEEAAVVAIVADPRFLQ